METNKEKLTLKELAGYLPFSLLVIHGETRKRITAISLNSPFVWCETYLGSRRSSMISIPEIKPILRPLSDLTKEITHNGETFVPIEKLNNLGLIDYDDIYPYTLSESLDAFIECDDRLKLCYPFSFWETLKKWHLDIHNLIERGLAININDLPND